MKRHVFLCRVICLHFTLNPVQVVIKVFYMKSIYSILLVPRTRLSGGLYPHEGRAEYLMDNGTWGTVCDTSYGVIHWPSVFCREAGYLRFVFNNYICPWKYLCYLHRKHHCQMNHKKITISMHQCLFIWKGYWWIWL